MLPKHVRFREFIVRLSALALAASHDEARRMIEETLNAVEDEFSGIPFNPEHWRTDGRLYPFQNDSGASVSGHAMVTAYRSRWHETFISNSGAFEIKNLKTNAVEISRPDANGNGVWS